MNNTKELLAVTREKIHSGTPVSREEGIALLTNGSLTELGNLASLARFGIHTERVVSYIVDRNINYTNVCVSGCRFCAFYRHAESTDAYLLDPEEIGRKISEALEFGATRILLQGGHHPELTIEYFEDLFEYIKDSFPVIIHALSPPEIAHIARQSGLTTGQTLKRLAWAGLDSIPGGGAEILVDRVRNSISPGKGTADEWLAVMEEAHGMGIRSTATMMFGHIEQFSDRIDHIIRIRELQDKTGGFTSFIPWTFQPGETELGGRHVTPVEYLKTLAVSRILLHNIKSIQVSWVTQGKRIAETGLHWGADDFGSLMIEENVIRATGLEPGITLDEMRASIRNAGFIPRLRGEINEVLDGFSEKKQKQV